MNNLISLVINLIESITNNDLELTKKYVAEINKIQDSTKENTLMETLNPFQNKVSVFNECFDYALDNLTDLPTLDYLKFKRLISRIKTKNEEERKNFIISWLENPSLAIDKNTAIKSLLNIIVSLSDKHDIIHLLQLIKQEE